MIRAFEERDWPRVQAMGCAFLAASPYRELAGVPDVDALRRTVDSAAFIRVAGDPAVGMLIGLLAPLWFAPDVMVAVELAWWVDPEARGGSAGPRLLHAFEQWAEEQGARVVVLSMLGDGDINPPKRGYRLTEQAFARETSWQHSAR